MRKSILILLSALILSTAINAVIAKPVATNAATSAAIKAYKSGDYTQAYSSLQKIIGSEPNNALALYYLAMTNVQLGKKQEAIDAYQRVVTLSPNGVLGSYAKKGKRCVETPLKCNEPEELPPEARDSEEDKFIKGVFGSGLSKEARGVYEREKMESLKRRINRNEELTPEKFKEYKDFSSEVPTNDEIVMALRILQRAGLNDVMGNNNLSGIMNSNGHINNNNYEMLNFLLGQKTNGTSNIDSRLIQSMLTTQMTDNF